MNQRIAALKRALPWLTLLRDTYIEFPDDEGVREETVPEIEATIDMFIELLEKKKARKRAKKIYQKMLVRGSRQMDKFVDKIRASMGN